MSKVIDNTTARIMTQQAIQMDNPIVAKEDTNSSQNPAVT